MPLQLLPAGGSRLAVQESQFMKCQYPGVVFSIVTDDESLSNHLRNGGAGKSHARNEHARNERKEYIQVFELLLLIFFFMLHLAKP
jgi:hypothetical protein